MSNKAKHNKANHKANYKRKPDAHKPDTGKIDKPDTGKIDKPDTVKTDKPDTVKTDKPDSTLITTHKLGSPDTVKLVDNKTGKPIVTDDDKAKIDAVKTAQKKYRDLKLKAQEALRKVKQEFEALDGSEAIKVLKAELETKIEAKQNAVTEARETFKALVDEYNSLLSEYQELTGISKKAVKVNGKTSTGATVSGNGSWLPTVKAHGKDGVRVIVKHAPTNDLFEFTLYGNGDTGLISYKHWIELRHAFTKHYQTLYDSLDTASKANFRAFLYPRLYGVISQVKAIADKPIA